MIANTEITYYFLDMDGVLARYEREAYKKEKGPTPGKALYEHEGSHYFRHCIPDPVAISLLRDLLQSPNTEIFILTTVSPHIPWAAEDKKKWLSQNVPEFDSDTHLIIAENDKAETIKAKARMGRLTDNMVLIDDFNANLIDWQNAGGLAIKYLNGINSADSFDGPVFDGLKCFMDA